MLTISKIPHLDSRDFVVKDNNLLFKYNLPNKNMNGLIIVYRDGCPHCEHIKPAIAQLHNKMKDSNNMSNVYCLDTRYKHSEFEGVKLPQYVMDKFGLQGVPSFLLINSRTKVISKIDDDSLPQRSLEDFENVIRT